ncbi:nuclease SbcCD subunit C [Desulfuromonas versatilis]|uniref:Nuclease SbcCD subunit C n=1 Tax=Desulfuromonas versatilis TaxID=2802975 RepID=A0ABM8HT80_9BACT|nr:SMC family ATPase [Desulfuromonas versatilis]BCR03897.1 nuclease SbcCD subunit C [Desulfuromonas versatilis]
MRPLSLTMTAFGPFPAEETIPFEALDENPLFLINGPTGAGKTTILDAICFALYGKTTGDEREGAQMRCDLAALETLTEVTLVFEFSGRRFRIRRVPEQQRPKARGEGTTSQSAEAQLFELHADGSETLLVASKVTEATREIEELTGLSVDQFRQVMVLPQGKFRQLLLADSSDREKIFSQLFQTRIYKRLEESLKAQAAEIRRERERRQQLRQGILEGAGVESDAALESELAELAPEVAKATKEKDRRELAFIAAGKDQQQAQALEKSFLELEKLQCRQAELNRQQETIDRERARLRAAEQAAKLRPVFDERARCDRDFRQTQKEAELAAGRLRNAEERLAAAIKRLEETAPLQSELDQAKQQATLLEGYRARADRMADTRQAWQKAVEDSERTELLLQHKLLAERKGLWLELERLGRELARQQKLLQIRKDQGGILRQRCEELEKKAKKLELAWHQGQAAILAAELQTGEPCPVCGSREHPFPARSEAPLPTQRQVEEARQELRAANDELQLAREQYGEEQNRLRELQQRQERCRQDLGAEADRPAGEIERALDELQAAANQRGLNPSELRQAQGSDLEQLRRAVLDRKSAAAAAKAQAETAEQELPEAYREAGALSRALDQARQQIAGVEKRIREISDSHQKALGDARAAKAAADAAEQQLRKTDAALQTAGAKCLSVLDSGPFADEQAYRAALLDEAPLEALRQNIADYDRQSQLVAGALGQQREALQGRSRPDLAALEEALRLAENEKNQAASRWQQLEGRLKLLRDTCDKLARSAAQQAELDRQYAVIGTLSDVANGQTGDKISLQRFVLSVLLDDVLIEASQRLSLMSKGRYQLLRKEERAKGNKASGLELEVEDAYTGKVRPVATLSGGESFMAALSLALGLSDVVQAYAGGVRLDTLFIDEGFGSLDAESLELAVRTLIDLQAAGRMIGVISHVAELKEQMPLRLDVFSGRDGSHTRLVLP